ncbi:MAG: TonB-dependent receptor [Thermoanaerobaculia bacterium]
MRSRHVLAIIGLALLLSTSAVFAQGVTSGSISGRVTDPDGEALPGATVTAIHEPTGTTYVAVTQTDGRFLVPSARVGGPYTVSVELEGFAPQVSQGITVSLGQATSLQVTLVMPEFGEELTVFGESDFISASRTGTADNVREELITSLPTVERGLNDFARTNPFFTVASQNEDPNAISVVGRNPRYNNIQVDGAVNNDLFGLADTGTPGGQTGTQPISLDAIQEVELVVSDYDVRQGGFSGGAVNVVTRSGTNDWKGSVYYFTRDNDYVGDGPEELGEFGAFSEDQYGFRLGGPIKENEAFFFVNGEISEEETPTGWSIDGSTGQAFGGGALVDEANRFGQILMDRYGYDPGGLGELTRNRDSDKLFGRLDFNLGTSHQLTLRHNYVDAEFLINRPDDDDYEFPNEGYLIADETNSTVVQLNSVLSANAFGEARLTYQTIKDRRHGVGQDFPHIEVFNVGPGGDFEFEAGTEEFSTFNELDQDIFELTYDLTWIRGDHNFVFGTHNELFDFRNLFIQNGFGSYEFNSLDDFAAGNASRFDYTAIAPGQPDAQVFDVQQIGLYAGDQWRVRPDLTLFYGLRVDVPFFPDEPTRNPFTEETYGLRTDAIPDGNELWQPRLGFNWDVEGNGKSQLRGGVGVFAGRTPYVWISNNYARTGIEQLFITQRGSIDFNPDPFGQDPDLEGAAIGEFNLIDPDFEFPQELRYTLAYDRELPWWGLQGSIEALYGDTLEGLNYQNVNLVQTGTLGLDGRPVFGEVDSDVTGAFLITNSSLGDSFNVAVKVEKPYSNGLWGYLSYAYGEATVVNEGTSSRAVSNWQFQEAVDPNNPPESPSDFEVEHRINAGVSYTLNRDSRYPTTIAAFYNRQSGRPFTYIYDFQQFPSINSDAFFDNDLFYVPAAEGEVIVTGGTWEQLNAYIESNECLREHRGSIAPRNCQRAPWSDSLDVRVAQDIPLKWVNLQLSVDLQNLMNLIDEDEGILEFVNFGTTDPVDFGGIDPATGKVIYELDSEVTEGTNLSIHNVESRWRAKLGLRVSF